MALTIMRRDIFTTFSPFLTDHRLVNQAPNEVPKAIQSPVIHSTIPFHAKVPKAKKL